MTQAQNVLDAIGLVQRFFAIVLALALGEAFKQFVADKAVKPEERVLHWDQIWALLSFLLLIFPFYQGMSRYLFQNYTDLPTMRQPYSRYLASDGVIFTLEAALFFIMARTLPVGQWRRFYTAVLILLLSDSVWGLASASLKNSPIEIWMILNAVFGGLLLIMIGIFWRLPRYYTPAIIGLVLILIRTVLDYYYSWTFYFPSYP